MTETTPDPIYEILFRGNTDGTLAGAHVVRWEHDGVDRNGVARYSPGMPVPVDPAEVSGLLGANVAAMAAQIAALQAEVAALKAAALEA